MRRDADREERNARLLAGVVLAAMLVMLSGIIHLLYHREYAETDTPNDCFAVSAATGETALPKIVCLTFDDGPSKNTRPILEILDKEQVPATFFVCAQDANEKISAPCGGHRGGGASDRAAQRDASILQNLCEHRRILAGHQNAAPGVGAVCGCGGHRLAAFPRRQHKHSQPRYGGNGIMKP